MLLAGTDWRSSGPRAGRQAPADQPSLSGEAEGRWLHCRTWPAARPTQPSRSRALSNDYVQAVPREGLRPAGSAGEPGVRHGPTVLMLRVGSGITTNNIKPVHAYDSTRRSWIPSVLGAVGRLPCCNRGGCMGPRDAVTGVCRGESRLGEPAWWASPAAWTGERGVVSVGVPA